MLVFLFLSANLLRLFLAVSYYCFISSFYFFLIPLSPLALLFSSGGQPRAVARPLRLRARRPVIVRQAHEPPRALRHPRSAHSPDAPAAGKRTHGRSSAGDA